MVKIFVGRLAETVTREDLQKLFEKYGEVSDCDILRDYGFVHMADENRAQKAIRELDRLELGGSRISVELSTSRSMRSCQLIVGNLPEGTSSADVHKLFKKFGTVTLCKISGGQAVVHMRWASMAVQAIRNLNGETYKGCVLSVQFATNTGTTLNKNLKDEWYAANTKPTTMRPVSTVGPRYNQSKPQTTGDSSFGTPWTKFVTNPPQSNHIMSNGTDAAFPSNPGTNQNNNLPNVMQSHNATVPPLIPNNQTGKQQDATVIGEHKTQTNSTDFVSSQSGDSPSHSSISSSSYEEASKQADINKLRVERRQKIQQGLQFLQSPRPWAGSPEDYATFLNQMKHMLLQEGTELKRESLFNEAVQKLSEGLNMCKYMESEGIKGHNTNLIILLAERSTALLELGQINAALEDANKAIRMSNGASQDGLRCKAKVMMKVGKAKEAYDMMLQFSHNNTLDQESTEMMNGFSQMLGLRTRKPYHPASQPFAPFMGMPPSSNDLMSGGKQDGPNFPNPSKPDGSPMTNSSMPKPIGNSQNDGNSYRPFSGSSDNFSGNFADAKFNQQNDASRLSGSLPNMGSFSGRQPLIQQPGGMMNMPGFNKTPGTALHGYPVGAGIERSGSLSNGMVNGVQQAPPIKAPVTPIGPGRIGSRVVGGGFGGFQAPLSATETQSESMIADSLRKNLEIMSVGDNQGGSLFGQQSRPNMMKNMMENSLDLVSGIQKIAVGQQLKENGIGGDMAKPSLAPGGQGAPGPQSSKMWDYMEGKPVLNNNNNTPGGTAGTGFNPGMQAPIGYRKPFEALGMGGDASSLLAPGMNQGIRPGFGGNPHNSSQLPFLTNSGDSAYNLTPGLNKLGGNDMKGSLVNEIKPPNLNAGSEYSFGMNMANSNTVMSTSNQFGAVRLSSGPASAFPNSGPSYSHFPQSSGHPTGLSQLFGPGAIGIGIPNTVPVQAQAKPPPQPTQPSAASVVLSQKAYSEKSEDSLDMMNPDEDESLDSYLRNPLHNTHEFCLGCSDCVIKTGSRVVDYRFDEHLNHMCYKNILLCRRRDSSDWHKIRPRPQPQSKAQLYDGPYYICKDLLAGSDCTYPVVCTFAYNQEEIDIWTLERKQMLNRRWLFDSLDEEYMRELSVVGRVLCKHRGLFNFLCQACFTNKPRIISTFSVGTGMCINADAEHSEMPDNRQLTHILRDTTVRYTAIRVPAQQAILCRHEVRFQCTREEDCHFAHSLVERDVWALMLKKALTPDQIVEQSREYITKLNTNINPLEQGITQTTDLGVPMFRWKVKFICSLCYKNGQISEATKDRKYCTARAQHSWATNKKTVLVQTIRKDWTQIRDLPYLKNKGLPARFELCENIRRQKKCPFSNKCNFAHSQEELDIWIYLRDNQLKDLEDLHDSLNKDKQQKNSKGITQAADPNAIRLPTDFLPQSAYHCWLCNKECNGQRQWEQHCSSVKHRLGALSDSDGNWKHRNPGGDYEICERHLKNICEYDCVAPVDNKCRFAHSAEELEEWRQRREYVLNRIKKAQIDQLISVADDMDKLIKESQQQQQ